MGCHTWMHAKSIKQYSFEEVKDRVTKHYVNEIGYYDRHISGTLKESEEFLFENETVESSKWSKEVLTRQLGLIKQGKCKSAIYNKFNECCSVRDEFNRSVEYDHKTDTFYVDLSGQNDTPRFEWYHDCFRIGGYPSDRLYSFEDTKNFIDRNIKAIRFGPVECINPEEPDGTKRKWAEMDRDFHYDECIQRLHEFWDKHPDGMIDFG